MKANFRWRIRYTSWLPKCGLKIAGKRATPCVCWIFWNTLSNSSLDKVRDRLGSYVEAGTEIAEVADTSTLRAFVYLSEYGVRDIGAGARASLRPDGSLASWRGTVTAISPASSEMAPGLMEKVAYKGLRPPVFYRLTVLLPNLDGALYSGMAGDAKVFVRRRSLAGFVWQGVRDFFARKVW